MVSKENASFVASQIRTSADAPSSWKDYSWSMNKQSVEVLIVTRSLVLQQGLGALLESLPGITRVKAIRELTEACAWIESRQPKIVLLDTVLFGNTPGADLEKIHRLSPETQRVLLVDDVQDVKWVPRYAEAILIKGVSPSAVATIVTDLLLSKGAENEGDDSSK